MKTRAQQAVYSVYLKYGQNTGYTYGRLESKTCLPLGTVPNPNATWMLVSNYFDLDDLIGSGDSGGPWFTFNYALGISHGEGEIGGVEQAVYMAIDYIDDLELEVMTE